MREFKLLICSPAHLNNANDTPTTRRLAFDSLLSQLKTQLLLAFPDQEPPVVTSTTVDYTIRGATEMLNRVRQSDLALVDISSDEPDVFFALGLLTARGLPAVLIQNIDAIGPAKHSSTADYPVYVYESIADLPVEMYRALAETIHSLFAMPASRTSRASRVWFADPVSDIHVVSSPEDHKSEFADPTASNHIYIDNLGDRDALLEVYAFLHRHYVGAQFYKYSSEDFPARFLERHIVTIGGPGFPGVPPDLPGAPGNSVCRRILERVGTSLSYAADGESAMFAESEYRTEYDTDGRVTRDFGYFARVRNPYNRGSIAILINGAHTLGVLGAAKAFSDHPDALLNVERALEAGGTDPILEAGFMVEMYEGAVLCPRELVIIPRA